MNTQFGETDKDVEVLFENGDKAEFDEVTYKYNGWIECVDVDVTYDDMGFRERRDIKRRLRYPAHKVQCVVETAEDSEDSDE